MVQEEDVVVEAGEGAEATIPKRTSGKGKSGQQVLSFRSRKLLQRNLWKTSDATNVEKGAAAAGAVLPLTTESTELGHIERSGTHTKEIHGEPTSTKARRTLWDQKGIESDSSKTASILSAQKSRKAENDSPIKNKQVVEDPKLSDDRVAVVLLPSKQQLKTPKLKLLETFYEGLEAACSLLRIRKQMCTFRAVCKIVESMSKRRFLMKHLAQIKHIFSEVLQLEYVRCQDPDSWGERWDLRITLLPLSSDCPHTSSPLKGSVGQTAQTIRRRKEFHARLVNFESSHSEDEDIPLDPLPRRPNSSASSSRAASPPTGPTPESNLSVQDRISEPSTQPAPAEPPSHTQTEEFEFPIVKPSRGNDTIPIDGTSHFFPSFRPFYSSIQTAQIVDGVAVRRSEVGQSSGALPLQSHFPASFKPSFSAGKPSDFTDGRSKISPPEEHKEEEGGVEFQSGARDGVLPSRCESGSVTPSSPCPPSTPVLSAISKELPSPSAKSSSPFLPSTPAPVVNCKELPSASPNSSSPFPPSTPIPSVKGLSSGSTDKNCREELQLDSHAPVSPVPISTPPFQSPMDKFYSSHQAKESLSKSPSEMPLTDPNPTPIPTKSHGIMRSLRFASPVRGCPPVKADDSDISRRPNSLGPASSVVYTPSPAEGSCGKSAHTSASAPSTPAYVPPGAPETPSLQTPVRLAHNKEIWYSPPKRTKLNQRSLFTSDKERDQEPCVSGSSTVNLRESCPEAVSGRLMGEGKYSGGPLEEASRPSILRPTAKYKGGITESDLDVIHCLPSDVVQSVWEKERKIKDDNSKELAKQRRRQQMMSGVPKLFNQLRLIFQSLNRSVLPEHELIKTLVASHPEITDRGEIEERLKLVIELAPDYIQTRPSHSSELLYRIDKRADVARIQRRLSDRSGN
ncbi:unnamed protein product [Calypogeia fissa]